MYFVAGFGYSFFDSRLNDYYQPFGLDEFSGYYHDTVSQPLVNQPGEMWQYGVNIDWLSSKCCPQAARLTQA